MKKQKIVTYPLWLPIIGLAFLLTSCGQTTTIALPDNETQQEGGAELKVKPLPNNFSLETTPTLEFIKDFDEWTAILLGNPDFIIDFKIDWVPPTCYPTASLWEVIEWRVIDPDGLVSKDLFDPIDATGIFIALAKGYIETENEEHRIIVDFGPLLNFGDESYALQISYKKPICENDENDISKFVALEAEEIFVVKVAFD